MRRSIGLAPYVLKWSLFGVALGYYLNPSTRYQLESFCEGFLRPRSQHIYADGTVVHVPALDFYVPAREDAASEAGYRLQQANHELMYLMASGLVSVVDPSVLRILRFERNRAGVCVNDYPDDVRRELISIASDLTKSNLERDRERFDLLGAEAATNFRLCVDQHGGPAFPDPR